MDKLRTCEPSNWLQLVEGRCVLPWRPPALRRGGQIFIILHYCIEIHLFPWMSKYMQSHCSRKKTVQKLELLMEEGGASKKSKSSTPKNAKQNAFTRCSLSSASEWAHKLVSRSHARVFCFCSYQQAEVVQLPAHRRTNVAEYKQKFVAHVQLLAFCAVPHAGGLCTG
jgi:hypothetical protein